MSVIFYERPCIWTINWWDHKNDTQGMTISTNVRNTFPETTSYSRRVYLSYKGNIQDEFTLNKEYRSWQNIPKFEDDYLTTSRKFYFSHDGPVDEINDLRLYATMKPYGTIGGRIPIPVEPEFIRLDDRTPVNIHYDWKQIPEMFTHAVVEIEISNGQSYQYLKEWNMPKGMFWTHFIQFLALAKLAMIVMLVGSKMGKLGLFERIDEYRFDYYEIPFKNIVLLIILSSIALISTYWLLNFSWFVLFSTVWLWIIAYVMWLFLFVDIIDWIFGIEEINEFEGSGHVMDQPWLGEGFNLKSTISLIISIVLMVSWYITRYWLLSNIVALWVAWTLVKIFRFNALYPAFLVLLGFLLFDIFWVLMSPPLFNGHSIIHDVLSNLDFPLKIVIPGFTPFIPCASLSIIDMVVPAFYVSFISRFGKEQHTNAYYLSHIIVYALSLGIVTWAVVYSESQQPALMYIIPLLFVTTWIVAGIRGEWKSKLSLDSSLESNQQNKRQRNSGKTDNESATARGMERFDPKQLEDVRNATEFKKFEDEVVHE